MSRRRVRATVAAALCLVIAAMWLCVALKPDAERAEPSEALTAASQGLDEISIDAALDPQLRELRVEQTMTLLNRTGTELNVSTLRAWPNAFQTKDGSPAASDELYADCYPDGFSSGALVMREASASIDGGAYTAAEWRYADEQKTVLHIMLGSAWKPDARIALRLSYTVTVPRVKYRFGVWDGIFALGNAFLTPALYENGEWREDPYGAVGDPLSGDCANYSVRVDVPSGYVCAGSSEPSAEESGGRTVYAFRALAARDFALVAGEGLKTARGSNNGVTVLSLALDAGAARNALRYASQALECYGNRYGAYPYPCFTCAEIAFPLGGMEYAGMAMLSGEVLNAGGDALEYLVAHEVAHQWWHAAVGSDSVKQPWQDEALCEFSVLEYLETRYGLASREERERASIQSAMRATVPGGLTAGMPADYFDSMSRYSLVVYNRGAALFCALDKLLPDGLDGFLREYYARFSYRRATREDFTALLFETTGEDLSPIITDYLDTKIAN